MNATVLIIDDDSYFSQFLALELQSNGIKVFLAKTADEGRKLFQKNENIDLIFLDVMLPDGSGIHEVKSLKSIREEIPIMMVSTNGDSKNVVVAMKAGASDYLQKPLKPKEIFEKIEPLLKMRRDQSTEKEIRNSDSRII